MKFKRSLSAFLATLTICNTICEPIIAYGMPAEKTFQELIEDKDASFEECIEALKDDFYPVYSATEEEKLNTYIGELNEKETYQLKIYAKYGLFDEFEKMEKEPTQDQAINLYKYAKLYLNIPEVALKSEETEEKGLDEETMKVLDQEILKNLYRKAETKDEKSMIEKLFEKLNDEEKTYETYHEYLQSMVSFKFEEICEIIELLQTENETTIEQFNDYIYATYGFKGDEEPQKKEEVEEAPPKDCFGNPLLPPILESDTTTEPQTEESPNVEEIPNEGPQKPQEEKPQEKPQTESPENEEMKEETVFSDTKNPLFNANSKEVELEDVVVPDGMENPVAELGEAYNKGVLEKITKMIESDDFYYEDVMTEAEKTGYVAEVFADLSRDTMQLFLWKLRPEELAEFITIYKYHLLDLASYVYYTKDMDKFDRCLDLYIDSRAFFEYEATSIFARGMGDELALGRLSTYKNWNVDTLGDFIIKMQEETEFPVVEFEQMIEKEFSELTRVNHYEVLNKIGRFLYEKCGLSYTNVESNYKTSGEANEILGYDYSYSKRFEPYRFYKFSSVDEKIKLPDKIGVLLGDQSEKEIPVTWKLMYPKTKDSTVLMYEPIIPNEYRLSEDYREQNPSGTLNLPRIRAVKEGFGEEISLFFDVTNWMHWGNCYFEGGMSGDFTVQYRDEGFRRRAYCGQNDVLAPPGGVRLVGDNLYRFDQRTYDITKVLYCSNDTVGVPWPNLSRLSDLNQYAVCGVAVSKKYSGQVHKFSSPFTIEKNWVDPLLNYASGINIPMKGAMWKDDGNAPIEGWGQIRVLTIDPNTMRSQESVLEGDSGCGYTWNLPNGLVMVVNGWERRTGNVTIEVGDRFYIEQTSAYKGNGWDQGEVRSIKSFYTTYEYYAAAYPSKQHLYQIVETYDSARIILNTAAPTYSVTYEANGGSGYMPKDTGIKYLDSYVTRANQFTRSGYTFKGWNESPNGTGTDWTSRIGQTWKWGYDHDVTLYAQWERNLPTEYTVTYHSNDGYAHTSKQQVREGYNWYTKPASTFVRNGYIIESWNTRPDGKGVRYEINSYQNAIFQDIHLYAQWKTIQYVVTYHPNGGVGSTQKQYVNSGASWYAQGDIFKKENAILESWNTKPNGSGEVYELYAVQAPLNKNLTLYAQWKATDYKVIYHSNDGRDFQYSYKYNIGEGFTTKGAIFTSVDRKLISWNTSPSGNGVAYKLNELYGPANKELHLYAQWKGVKYVVHYEGNGTTSGETLDSVHQFDVPQKLNPNGFVKDGYVFEGWTTITPEGHKYKVTYHANNGSNETKVQEITPDEQWSSRGEIFTTTDKVLESWNTRPDGSGTRYELNAVQKVSKSNLNLYAQWKSAVDEKYMLGEEENQAHLIIPGDVVKVTFTDEMPPEDVSTKNVSKNVDGHLRGWYVPGTKEYKISSCKAGQKVIFNPDSSDLFSWKLKLTEINFNHSIDTSLVIYMNNMFYFYQGQELDLSDFNTENVKYTINMFSSASYIKVLDLSSFDTRNLKNAGNMFDCMYRVKTIYVSDKWDCEKLKSIYSGDMFRRCDSLIGQNGQTYDENLVDGDYANYEYGYLTYKPAPKVLISNRDFSTYALKDFYYDQEEVVNLTDQPDDIITMYAVWRKEYTVTYEPNGGEGDSQTEKHLDGEAWTTKGPIFTSNKGEIESWNTSPDGSGIRYELNSVQKPLNSNLVLYAQYQPRQYIVHYEGNGETSGMTPDSIHQFDVPQKLNPNGFIKDGYTFDGWTTIMPDGYQYEVTYHANDGTDKTEIQKVSPNIIWNAKGTIFTATGRVLDSWNTSPDGNGIRYELNSTQKALNKSLDLYAQWKINSFIVEKYMLGEEKMFTHLIIPEDVVKITFTDETPPEGVPTKNVSKHSFGHLRGWYVPGTEEYKISSCKAGQKVIFNPNSSGLFAEKPNLTEINFNHSIDTSLVTDMSFMFYLYGGQELDLSDFNTENVTDMHTMFSGLNYIKVLDLSSFDTRNLTRATDMFRFLESLKTIYVSDKWDCEKLKSIDSSNMFLWCDCLIGQNGQTYDENHVDGDYANYEYGYLTYKPAPKVLISNRDFSTYALKDFYKDQEEVVNLTDKSGDVITMYAVWKKEYTVTYKPNGGTESPQFESVKEGESWRTKGDVFTRGNYMLESWNTEPDGTGTRYELNSVQNPLQKDLVLYAQWKPMVYHVIYHANDGTDVTITQDVSYGEVWSTKGEIFTRDGYDLASWNLSQDGMAKIYNLNEIQGVWTQTSDIHLYATWTKKLTPMYHVIYHSNDGTNNEQTQNVRFGDKWQTEGQIFNRSGYILTKWNTKENGSGADYQLASAQSKWDSTVDIHLYAQWQQSGDTFHTVTYHSNNSDNLTQSFIVNKGESWEVKGSLFLGGGRDMLSWNTEPDGSGITYEMYSPQKPLEKDLDLYAQWKEIPKVTYTVTYKPNGGVGSEQVFTYEAGTSWTTKSAIFTKENHTMTSWNTKFDGSGRAYLFDSRQNDINKNIVLYAQWKKNESTDRVVTYHSNDGTNQMQSDIFSVGQDWYVRDAIFKNKGKTLKSWNTRPDGKGVRYDFYAHQMNITDNLDLYAQWSDTIYTDVIHHYLNGIAQNGDRKFHMSDVTFGAVYNSKFVLDKADSMKMPNGYVLDSKFETMDIEDILKKYPMGTKVTQIDRNMEFTYTYSPQSYKITYRVNGGMNNPDNPESYNVLHGVTLKDPTRQDYVFEGWFTVDGVKVTGINEGKDATFTTLEEIMKELASRETGDVTLVAKWKPSHIKVHYNANSGVQPNTLKTDTVRWEDAEKYPIKKNRSYTQYEWDNHQFAGWSIDAKTKAKEKDKLYMDSKDFITDIRYKLTNPDGTEEFSFFAAIPNDDINRNLHAIWDTPPTITVPGIKSTTEGLTFTEEQILEGITVKDNEDSTVPLKVISIQYSAGRLKADGTKEKGYTVNYPNGMSKTDSLDTWFMKLDPADSPVEHNVTVEATDSVGNKTQATVKVQVKYNQFPTITARDRYFTLEEAQSGAITSKVLLEDEITKGEMKTADFEETSVNQYLELLDFNADEFKNFTESGYRRLTLKTHDTFGPNGYGKETLKQIIVYVVKDGEIPEVDSAKEVRFISRKYYDKNDGVVISTEAEKLAANKNGGLNVESKWYTDNAYKTLIKNTFDKTKGDTAYFYELADVNSMREYVEAHGIGNSKEDDALANFATQFMSTKYVAQGN